LRSYRMLGLHTMERLCGGACGDFLELSESILTNHLGLSVPDWLAELIVRDGKNSRPQSRPHVKARLELR
jgi:hypothetical protein